VNALHIGAGVTARLYSSSLMGDRDQAVVEASGSSAVLTALDDGRLEVELSRPGSRIRLLYFEDSDDLADKVAEAIT
jgi:hypothetical protein